MHIEYTLPDLDFLITAQHKSISSVIVDMVIQKKVFSGNAVTYSGLTYCTMCSIKHWGSSDYHQLQDMKRIGSLDTFMEAALTFLVLGKLKNSISEIPKFPYTAENLIKELKVQSLSTWVSLESFQRPLGYCLVLLILRYCFRKVCR